MNRQKTVLALLVVVFALAVAYGYMRWPRQKKVEKLKFVTGMTVDTYRTVDRGEVDTKLRLDLLDRDHTRFSGFRRNIFKPIFSNPVKIAAIPKTAPKPAPLPPPPPPPPVEKTPAQVAMEEVGQYAFLGYLQKENRKTVFLTKNNEIFLVKKGDKIIGKYEVADINENMMIISLAPGGEQVTISLQQNRPLAGGAAPAGPAPSGRSRR